MRKGTCEVLCVQRNHALNFNIVNCFEALLESLQSVLVHLHATYLHVEELILYMLVLNSIFANANANGFEKNL